MEGTYLASIGFLIHSKVHALNFSGLLVIIFLRMASCFIKPTFCKSAMPRRSVRREPLAYSTVSSGSSSFGATTDLGVKVQFYKASINIDLVAGWSMYIYEAYLSKPRPAANMTAYLNPAALSDLCVASLDDYIRLDNHVVAHRDAAWLGGIQVL